MLIASMACVVVWLLQHDDSAEDVATQTFLIRLSGLQMKSGAVSTAPVLPVG